MLNKYLFHESLLGFLVLELKLIYTIFSSTSGSLAPSHVLCGPLEAEPHSLLSCTLMWGSGVNMQSLPKMITDSIIFIPWKMSQYFGHFCLLFFFFPFFNFLLLPGRTKVPILRKGFCIMWAFLGNCGEANIINETVRAGSVTQSCPTLCDPMDCSPQGFSVCGISQARILQWVAISYSRGPSQPRDQTRVSYIGRWIIYCCATWEAPGSTLYYSN